MLKVMLIDDEQNVLIGLQHLVDWDRLGYTICGMYQDPAAALRDAQTLLPELVITDIEMPVISGLDLIASLRELLPDSVCAVLSAYDDFRYAQQAVKLGVFRYLLKPLSSADLTDLLNDVSVRLLSGSSTAVAPAAMPV